MIALPSDLPFIRVSHENLARCEPQWLLETLQKAAKRTDDVPPWLAEDVCKGVESYLRNHYEEAVIDLTELFDRIRSTLECLGLQSLADEVRDEAPPIRISLTELARKAGTGYELVFFKLLEHQFASATNVGSRFLICYGLRKCVKNLVDAERWTPRCEALKTEIMEFLDHEYQKAASSNPTLTLAVN